MERRTIWLISVAVVLLGLYLAYFAWPKLERIEIVPQVRPVLGGRRFLRAAGPTTAVSFTLSGSYRLNSVKVVPLAAFETNKYTPPVWQLESKTNSVPTRGFVYGLPINGMAQTNPKARPGQLQPNVTYRLFVRAGRASGQVDFHVPPPSTAAK